MLGYARARSSFEDERNCGSIKSSAHSSSFAIPSSFADGTSDSTRSSCDGAREAIELALDKYSTSFFSVRWMTEADQENKVPMRKWIFSPFALAEKTYHDLKSRDGMAHVALHEIKKDGREILIYGMAKGKKMRRRKSED